MLNDTQLQQFEEDGFIFVPDLFTAEEVDVLKDEIPEIFAQQRPEVVREKSGGAVRTALPLIPITTFSAALSVILASWNRLSKFWRVMSTSINSS